jgi:hypothetical protein
MIKPDPKMRYGLFAIAIVCVLSGGVVNFIFINNFVIRSLSLVLLIAGVLLSKSSNIRGIKEGNLSSSQGTSTSERKRPGWLSISLSLASAGAIGMSYIYMRKDVLAGGHEVWPAYAFAVSVLVAAVVWGYVVAKLVQR